MRRLGSALVAAAIICSLTSVAAFRPVETLRATSALPAHIAGSFLDPMGFQQTDDGRYYVFDRRGHAVYTLRHDDEAAKKVIEVGAEPGRVLDPGAFDIDPTDGTFVIADSPGHRERLQTFTSSGGRIGGFLLPGRALPRLTIGTLVLNGVGSLQYTGRTILLNEPERGALITEYESDGSVLRLFGDMRQTGHEADRDVHLALNTGLPLIDPTGGFFFVFQAGVPVFRKYDAKGRLLYERHIEGAEVDEYLRTLPTVWPRQKTAEGDVIPFVPPAVRAAAVDRRGNLWVSLAAPVTYVFDPAGDKIRVVQFRAAGVVAPSSMFFTKDGRLLVTPGLFEFRP